MSTRTRRQFLEESMFAAAAAVAASTPRLVCAEDENEGSGSGANDRLGVACVGVKGRGGNHLSEFASRDPKRGHNTEVLYIVDVDEKIGRARVEEVAKRQGRAPQWVADMRKAFDDKSVDVVSTATPNHWHSLTGIWAMQAGKDVYVEKPVSHNVSEGRRMVEVARKYQRICQTGTQSRASAGTKALMKYLHDGQIGQIKVARGLCYKRRVSIGPKGNYEVPAHINYDLWCGPAPLAPLTRKELHYDWHWIWNYGNGDLGNQGIHQMDLARWGLNVDRLSNSVLSYGGRLGYEDAGETANTQVVVHDYGDKSLVFEVRGLETQDYRGARVGVIFEGTEGYAVMTSYEAAAAFDLQGKMVKSFGGGGDHFGNFIKAVRSRKVEDLNADILQGHLSSALCHLGNISYRLGEELPIDEVKKRVAALKTNDNAADTLERTLQHLASNNVELAKTRLRLGPQLALDPVRETFIGSAPADAMLTREYRAPYIVPTADKI